MWLGSSSPGVTILTAVKPIMLLRMEPCDLFFFKLSFGELLSWDCARNRAFFQTVTLSDECS